MSYYKKLIKSKLVLNMHSYIYNLNYPIHKKYTFNKKLGELKDINKDKRCFIIGNGPSLNISDLNKLKNEITFGFNSIIKIYEGTDWRPTYFCIQDDIVLNQVKDQLSSIIKESSAIFLRRNAYRQLCFSIRDSGNIYYFPLRRVFTKNDNFKFTNDITKIVYDGTSITYSAIQIAAYMGFNEIYLVGIDHNFPISIDKKGNKIINNNIKNHFTNGDFSVKVHPARKEELTQAYNDAYVYCLDNNIKIFNATRGGSLEVFPRRDLDEVLKRGIEAVNNENKYK